MGNASILRMLFVLTASTAALPAMAATVTNAGDQPVELQVVESAGRMDISLDPGATEEICPGGCFLTLPNGDRVGLTGNETVTIKDGGAVIK